MSTLKLPCLRGKMGDWFYYVSLMKFKDLAERTSMVPEIHKNQELSHWIQREVSERTEDIVKYLLEQDQRFFNSIIFGLYGGKPHWQEIDIDNTGKMLSEEEVEYFGQTFGVLSLNGQERIFAIDGQHRTKAIKDAMTKRKKLGSEEVAVIFVAHRNDIEGEIRTRRLFSTLNRYAAPVTPSEIIALDEEDNCAILTRKLIEESDLFKNKILFSKTRSIHKSNTENFTNIIILYDIISTILTNKKVINISVGGYPYKEYISRRAKEQNLSKDFTTLTDFFEKVFTTIPVLNKFFFKNTKIDRTNNKTSLLFRPIGQNILFSVLKIAQEKKKLDAAIDYFAKNDFSINNPFWNDVFYDKELASLKTDKSLQKFAIQVILKNLKISVALTPKDKQVFKNFKKLEI
ncbi:DNA sulfur modification protein DndB [Chryseobacterium arthrosphaerae]|uniref:DNA sulfur modification protein DndB n=1 Tax=Chryseobacterium arthrosphaerae TaxID=651561 RepID=UPI001F4B8517|nr:DNA sulfur modification protein DndB [Chryseobacterium arthrosphaerae]